MNKRTVLVLSTTMMSIATAACAFCVAQSASAAEVSTSTISGVSTAKVTTPPPIENISSQETNSSETNGIKSSDPSDSSDKDNIKPETNSKPNSNTKTESKLEAKSDVKSDAKLDVKSDSKLDTKTNVNTVVKTTAKSNVDSAVNTDTKDESNIDSKSKVSENSVSPTIFNQALFASGKPDPNQTPKPQTQTTELKIMFQWGEMNDEYANKNNSRLVKANSDFGEVSTNWDWGTSRKSDGKDVETEFEGIEYKITDNNDGTVVTKKSSIPKDSITTSVSLGNFDSSHTYTVSVVNTTIPSPYFVTYNAGTNDGKEFTPDIYSFTWEPSKGKNKDLQEKCIRLDVLEIVYAKDESVASKCFSYTQPKDVNGEFISKGNWSFKYNNDNIFARLRVKDNAIQFPTTNPTKVGYKFAGWQFYVAKKKNGKPYTSFDRMFDDNKKVINSTTDAYSDFGIKPFIDYPYLFAIIRDNKGVNAYSDKCGSQYGLTSRTFVVFPKWIKEADHTVTFMNEGSEYAKVKVQAGESISAQSMPTKPSKYGYSFIEWNTDSTGKDKTKVFTASTKIDNDMTVYAIYKNYSPTLTLQDKTITEGESLDLNSLIVSAKDTEDGDITSKVKLTDNGGFDNTKVGSYKITFSVTDNGSATATASATVIVTKKPTPPTPEPTPTPTPEPEPELEPAPAPAPSQPEQPEQPEAERVVERLPQTGSTTTPVLASAIASLFAGLAGFAKSFAATRKRRN